MKPTSLVIPFLILAACAGNRVAPQGATPDELFAEAMRNFERRRFTEAIQHFERFVLEFPADRRVQEARYRIGDAYFHRKEYVTAATELVRLATDYPGGEWADDARARTCEAYGELSPRAELDQQYTVAAIAHCRAFIDYFPNHPFVERAQAIVSGADEKLAAKIYRGGEFYLKNRAYDSAVIYYEDVVAEHPRTSYAPRALLRLVEIYRTLRYVEEAETTRQRLMREYPQSAEAGLAQGMSLATGT
jgi:outer membrane protein assembly factor BamD